MTAASSVFDARIPAEDHHRGLVACQAACPVHTDARGYVSGFRRTGCRELIRREIAVIQALGVELRCGVTVGADVSTAELRQRHRAVLIAVDAKRSRLLGLPGEAGPGVFGGVDLLRAVVRLNGWGPVEIVRDTAGKITSVVLRRCLRVFDAARRPVAGVPVDHVASDRRPDSPVTRGSKRPTRGSASRPSTWPCSRAASRPASMTAPTSRGDGELTCGACAE